MTTATVTAATALKSVREIKNAPGRHWVGDGFPVQGMFGYGQGAQERSPFLMLDYAAPTQWRPGAFLISRTDLRVVAAVTVAVVMKRLLVEKTSRIPCGMVG